LFSIAYTELVIFFAVPSPRDRSATIMGTEGRCMLTTGRQPPGHVAEGEFSTWAKDDVSVYTARSFAHKSSLVNVTRWYDHVSALPSVFIM
jgi:hypothetical protein